MIAIICPYKSMQEMQNILDEIENSEIDINSMDINKQIDYMYAYYVLDMILCKMQHKDDTQAREGLKKAQILIKKYSKSTK